MQPNRANLHQMPGLAADLPVFKSVFTQSAFVPYIRFSCLCGRNLSNTSSRNTILWKHNRRQRPLPLNRLTSTIAPVTAVNASKDIPPLRKPLYDGLVALESKAGTFVNLSQLQLALKGLESRDAVIRVSGKVPS